MNSNNSGSFKDLKTSTLSKIKRRNFFYYVAAGAASVYALSRMPFGIFKSKAVSASRVTVKENPYAVKREVKGRSNG